MSLQLNPLQQKIGRHLLFWAGIVLLYFIIEVTRGKPELFGYIVVRQLPCDMVTTYFTYYVIVEQFLLKKTLLDRRHTAGSFSHLIHFWCLDHLLSYHNPTVYPEAASRPWLNGPGIIQVGIGLYYVAFMFAGLKLYRIWKSNKEDQQELEKQNLKSELALLRAQINPHFLFNTLNNIDTLVFEDQNKASESIVKLSAIMRYMLNDTSAERVPLEKEINCLENFIDLHRLRLKQPDFIEFQVMGDPRGHLIPAMVFLPFVENTFKHGSMQGPKPGITIHIHIERSRYILKVSNRLRNKHAPYELPSGVGLQNVRRRLELIYGAAYQLDVVEENSTYTVKLVIPELIKRSEELLNTKESTVNMADQALLIQE